MAKATILFVDNEKEFLKTRSEFLEEAGYQVLPANHPDEAKTLLEQRVIHLVILDIRLIDDNDEKDISGLTLAKEMPSLIPKIILTNYPSVSAVREALKPQSDGLPPAVEFIDKHEGPEALIKAINKALGPDTEWLHNVKQAIDWTDVEIKKNHDNARKQSDFNYWVALIVAVLGIIIIIIGILLLFFRQVGVGIVSSIGGILTEAVFYLFYKRVDLANERIDQYHEELIEGRRFQTLLQACDGIDSKKERESSQKQIIFSAAGRWLGRAPKGRIITESQDGAKKG